MKNALIPRKSQMFKKPLFNTKGMKLLSWNVNGIRACLKKGFLDVVKNHDPDIFCIQETKAHPDQVDLDLRGYHHYWNSADKKGYSGTAIFTKKKPLSVTNGLGISHHDTEGRVITAEFPKFYFVTVYTPNAQHGLKRIDYRMQWDKDFLAHIKKLEEKKPVIFCGDLNVAHKEMDLANPDMNRNNPGFSDQERARFDTIIRSGFIDTFRQFNKEPDNYTWWTYRFKCRQRNVGWRIDYFLTSPKLLKNLKNAYILADIMGSDHCPVGLELK